MSEAPQTPQEKKEAAAIRRRWITLGEVLAVIAVLISGLTLWNSYSERSTAESERQAEKRAEQQEKAQHAATLLLRGTPDAKGSRLALVPLDGEQAIQGQTIAFPAALGVRPVETVSDSRVEADWFDDALKAARKAAGKADESKGDERLPVAITTRFFADGATHDDVALYDVGYKTEGGGLFGGTDLTLRGLSLVRRVTGGNPQASLDALWKARENQNPRS